MVNALNVYEGFRKCLSAQLDQVLGKEMRGEFVDLHTKWIVSSFAPKRYRLSINLKPVMLHMKRKYKPSNLPQDFQIANPIPINLSPCLITFLHNPHIDLITLLIYFKWDEWAKGGRRKTKLYLYCTSSTRTYSWWLRFKLFCGIVADDRACDSFPYKQNRSKHCIWYLFPDTFLRRTAGNGQLAWNS